MKLLRVFAVCLAALPLSLPVLAETKISKVKARVATVDVERCVGETEDGLRAKATLAKARLRRDSALYAMEERLKVEEQKLQDMIKASGGATPTPAIQKAALDYQKDLQDYQNASKQAQKELNALEDQLFLPIEKKVQSIFTRLAEAKGYDILVDRRSMPISLKPDLDLTEEVIREYNWGTAPAASGSASAK